MYTDASKYGWAGVLTRRHTSTVGGKEITMEHPVSYVSGLFCGSQLNWLHLLKKHMLSTCLLRNLHFILQDMKPH